MTISLSFRVSPCIIQRNQNTPCVLEVTNESEYPITKLRLSVWANSENIVLLRGERIEFERIEPRGIAKKEIEVCGKEVGPASLIIGKITGLQKQIRQSFPVQEILMDVRPEPLPSNPHLKPTPIISVPSMEYLECWVEIRRFDKGYQVTIRSEFGEEASHSVSIALDDYSIKPVLSGMVAPKAYGEKLFDQLFSRSIYAVFSKLVSRADSENKGLRIRLLIQPPELNSIAWELLYDPEQARFLSLHKYTPVVRYAQMWQTVRPLHVETPLKVLGLAISPNGLSQLDLEEEKAQINRVLHSAIEAGKVAFHWSKARTWEEFQKEIRNGDWNVLHFIGHSALDQDQGGWIYMEYEDGSAHPIRGEDFALPLADHHSLRLVVLNSCSGASGGSKEDIPGLAATLVQCNIPAVIGMQAPIFDREAIRLAYKFYESLVDGLPVDAALSEVRQFLKVNWPDAATWAIPVLFMRSKDGKLFTFRN